jgi:hypothetical protein
LPVALILSFFPTNFFSRAYVPVTPPITPPTATFAPPTATSFPTPTPLVISPTPILTATPMPTALPTTSLSPTLIPTYIPTSTQPDSFLGYATVLPTPARNSAPKIITSVLGSGMVGKNLVRDVIATDRDADQMTMTAENLPPGLSFGSCVFRIINGTTRTSELLCKITGTPLASRYLFHNSFGC